jgi:hypothetical protein
VLNIVVKIKLKSGHQMVEGLWFDSLHRMWLLCRRNGEQWWALVLGGKVYSQEWIPKRHA